jgi:hypothetical protein
MSSWVVKLTIKHNIQLVLRLSLFGMSTWDVKLATHSSQHQLNIRFALYVILAGHSANIQLDMRFLSLFEIRAARKS